MLARSSVGLLWQDQSLQLRSLIPQHLGFKRKNAKKKREACISSLFLVMPVIGIMSFLPHSYLKYSEGSTDTVQGRISSSSQGKHDKKF